MYCSMLMPTGPSPLSADAMTTLSLFLMVVSRLRWKGVRFVFVGRGARVSASAVVNRQILVSISVGGSGARQDAFLNRRLLGS